MVMPRRARRALRTALAYLAGDVLAVRLHLAYHLAERASSP
jgi:hypothetical protein